MSSRIYVYIYLPYIYVTGKAPCVLQASYTLQVCSDQTRPDITV